MAAQDGQNVSTISENIAVTINTLKSLVPERLLAVKTGIVCGSGLSTLAASLRESVLVPYGKLEGFGTSTVLGHKSTLAFGLLGPGEGVPVVAMLGRFHPYEGYGLATVVYPIRVLSALGVKNIIITNASGSLNPDIPVGTIVVIRDHIALPNMSGPLNPLIGPPLYPSRRFLPLSTAYSPALRRLTFLAALTPPLAALFNPPPATNAEEIVPATLAEGTYAWVSGPTYETPAEGRFLRAAGADVVGMSTIPEVVAAREEEMEVLVLSLVTNAVVIPDQYRSIREEVEAELAGKPLPLVPEAVVSHEEVLAIGAQKADVMRHLVERIVELISEQGSSG